MSKVELTPGLGRMSLGRPWQLHAEAFQEAVQFSLTKREPNELAHSAWTYQKTSLSREQMRELIAFTSS